MVITASAWIDRGQLAAFLRQEAAKPDGDDGGDNWVLRYSQDAEAELGVDTVDFATRLQAASEAHHQYEEGLGHADPDWAGWYANHMCDNKNSEV